MTKDDIIKLAAASYDRGVADAKQDALAALEQIVAAARAAEREECARVCEAQGEYGDEQYAKAIRARGTT